MLCYACFQRSAGSLEHIFPVFLGGRKRVRILCYVCNNKFGRTFEQHFYKDEDSKKLTFLKIALNFYFYKGLLRKEVLGFIAILNAGTLSNVNIVVTQVFQECFDVQFYSGHNFAVVFCGKWMAEIELLDVSIS